MPVFQTLKYRYPYCFLVYGGDFIYANDICPILSCKIVFVCEAPLDQKRTTFGITNLVA